MSTDWMASANCAGVDTQLFFPDRGYGPNVRKALEFCAGCPVLQQCKETNQDVPFGVFFGTLATQRRDDTRLCGTPEGFRRHQTFFAQPCEDCRNAWAELTRWRQQQTPRDMAVA